MLIKMFHFLLVYIVQTLEKQILEISIAFNIHFVSHNHLSKLYKIYIILSYMVNFLLLQNDKLVLNIMCFITLVSNIRGTVFIEIM